MDYKKVPQQINDVVGDNVKKLAQLFPSAVKDGEVDFEALKEEGIYVRHFSKPERISNYLRISVGTDREMETFIQFLTRYLESR